MNTYERQRGYANSVGRTRVRNPGKPVSSVFQNNMGLAFKQPHRVEEDLGYLDQVKT